MMVVTRQSISCYTCMAIIEGVIEANFRLDQLPLTGVCTVVNDSGVSGKLMPILSPKY